MGKEDLNEFFNKSLQSSEKDHAAKNKPVLDRESELEYKYSQEIEKQLIETEKRILQDEALSPIILVIEKIADSINKKEKLGKHKPKGYFNDSLYDKGLEPKTLYDVEFLGKHSQERYIEKADKAKLVDLIERGSTIEEAIKSFSVQLYYNRMVSIWLDFKFNRNESTKKFSKLVWRVGKNSGEYDCESGDIYTFITQMTSMIAEREYLGINPDLPVGNSSGGDWGNWSIN